MHGWFVDSASTNWIRTLLLSVALAATGVSASGQITAPAKTQERTSEGNQDKPDASTTSKAKAGKRGTTPGKEAEPTRGKKPGKPGGTPGKTTKVEVVSADLTAKTITVKEPSGNVLTLKVSDSAAKSLDKIHAGDEVSVTAAGGEATKITKSKSTAAGKKEDY